MKRIVSLSLLASALILSGCASRALNAPTEPGFYGEPQVGMVGGEAVAELPAAAPDLARSAIASNAATDADRLVIQTAALTLVVGDPVEKSREIRHMAESMGGFVVNSYIYQSSYGDGLTADNATVSVRVPAERLEEALEQIKADAVEVRTESIAGEDVTAQYVDLESRMRNLQAAEEQLMEIMDTAVRVEDVLAVHNQLTAVRAEIELVRGQMKYYEESSAFSMITAELIPDVAAQPIETGGWQPQGTVKAAVEALIEALQWVADAAIWLAICVLPIALLVGLPVFLIVRAARRRRTKAAMTAPPST